MADADYWSITKGGCITQTHCTNLHCQVDLSTVELTRSGKLCRCWRRDATASRLANMEGRKIPKPMRIKITVSSCISTYCNTYISWIFTFRNIFLYLNLIHDLFKRKWWMWSYLCSKLNMSMVEMLPKNLYSESHVHILLERARGSNIYMLLQNKLNRISDEVLSDIFH